LKSQQIIVAHHGLVWVTLGAGTARILVVVTIAAAIVAVVATVVVATVAVVVIEST
jgi:hypothetical protein